MIKPPAKSVLIPLGLTAADAGIRKKILGSGHNNTKTLIISNNEMEGIIKIVKSLEDSGLLLKGVSETKRRISKYVARYIRCKFIRKYIDRSRNK